MAQRGPKDALVVGADIAYPDYRNFAVYFCPDDSRYRIGADIRWMGFYDQQQIQPEIAQILGRVRAIRHTHSEAYRRLQSGDATERRIGEVMRDRLRTYPPQAELYQLVWLTAPDDPRTRHL